VKRFILVLLLASPLSFAIGFWWSTPHNFSVPLSMRGELRILSIKGFFSPAWIKDLEKKTHLQITVTEAKNYGELDYAYSEDKSYDLVLLNTSYGAKAIRERKLQGFFFRNQIRNIDNISIDFSHLPYDSENKFLLPIAWHVLGFLSKKEGETAVDSWAEILERPKIFGKIAIEASPEELLWFLVKNNWVQKDWLKESDKPQLKKAFAKFSEAFEYKSGTGGAFDLNRHSAILTSNGQVAEYMIGQNQKTWNFQVPKEGSLLEVHHLGVARDTRKYR
jgi:hypothetical protein